MVKISAISSRSRAQQGVAPDGAPKALDRLVRELFGVSWGAARALVRSGKISVDGVTCIDFELKIRAKSVIVLDPIAPKKRTHVLDMFFGADRIAYVDAQIVVVRKPSGISTVRFEDEPGVTLDELVRKRLSHRSRAPLGVVHRLDKETSGLLVFTRTWEAKKHLSSQFRFHTTTRRYVAIANGRVAPRTIRSEIKDDRGDGLRGSRRGGRLAVTHVEVIERFAHATLISCRLETGRTHQIRIHLSEGGNPIAGERVYVRGYDGPLVSAPRLMLHATLLEIEHPTTGARMRFEDPPPSDFEAVLRALREK